MYSKKQKKIYEVLQSNMKIKNVNCDSMMDDVEISFVTELKEVKIIFKECYKFEAWKDIKKNIFLYKDLNISQLINDSIQLYICELRGININIIIWCKDIIID
jgi:hypothetical protein